MPQVPARFLGGNLGAASVLTQVSVKNRREPGAPGSCNLNLAIRCAVSSKKAKRSRRFAHFLTRFLSRPIASNTRLLHLNSESSTGIHQTTSKC
jgi:hypothetical protein